jgi:hypothetical protein
LYPVAAGKSAVTRNRKETDKTIMMNSSSIEIPVPISGAAQRVRLMPRPVGRKQAKDPMKRFPFLFQFSSTRFSEAHLAATTGEAEQKRQLAKNSRFLTFRSPSDQLCILAMPSWQVADRPEASFKGSTYRLGAEARRASSKDSARHCRGFFQIWL